MSIMDIQVLERLGEGQYGVVTKVLYKPTDTVMALKVRPRPSNQPVVAVH